MTSIAENVISEIDKEAPNVPVVQLAEAAVNILENPNTINIVSDVELIISLVKQLHEKLSGLHPTILSLLKALL